ncbi:MAG: type I-B CRISPR-associated protein Cas7/Cst2/DevR [Salinibacter sp.]
MSQALALGYLSKVSAANVNASHTEGNVAVTKKVTLPDGSARPYISGQAIRRMLRERLADLGYELSEPFAEVSGQEVTPPVRPWDFVDEDLFGYLDSSGGHRRTSPVRASAAIGQFPFQDDRDLGTRSFERFGETMAEGGNLFETELYANVFAGNVLVELDRVGVFPAVEVAADDDHALEVEARRTRVRTLLESLNLLWGGGRTARMLTDLSPTFVAYSRLAVKHPAFLESLVARYGDGGYELALEPLTNALDKFAAYREQTLFGLEPGVFANEAEIRETLGAYGAVAPVHEAIANAQSDVDALWSKSSA